MEIKNRTRKKRTKTKVKIPSKKTIAITISALCLALVIVITAVATNNHKIPNPLLSMNEDVASGIDISSHNGKVDWNAVSEVKDFAFIRVGFRGYSNGIISADKNAKENIKSAEKAEIPIGVYFYSQAITPEEAQEEAEFVLKQIKGHDISLAVVIDFEYAYEANGELGGRLYNAGLTRKENTAIVNAFCKVIKKAGYTAGVYANSYFYKSVLNPESIDNDVLIWVADYNSKVTYSGEYDIWQYSKTGSCDGVSSKNVDEDYWFIK
jgi:GH25 family lysozyme M1 (1,4-beta-N-acetylmuramidase)